MDKSEQEQTLTLQPKRVLYILGGTEIVLLILSLIGQYLRLFPNPLSDRFPLLVHYFITEFDVNAEHNIPTYYSVSLAMLCVFLLSLIAYFKFSSKDKYRLHWAALAAFLLYISMDDASVIHEKTSKYLKGATDMGGWFEYKWVILGLVVIGILAISFFRFWLHLDHKYKILFLVSAGLFFGGAVGTEMIGGRWAYSHGADNYIYKVFTTLEQGLQYGGLLLLVYSLLLYIKSYFPQFAVAAKNSSSTKIGEKTIFVQPRSFLYILVGVGIVVTLLGILGQYLRAFPDAYHFRFPFQADAINDFSTEFDVTDESNIVTYYNVLLLNFAALLLWIVTYLKRAINDDYKSYWAALTGIVWFMALDDMTVIHEKIGAYLKDWMVAGGFYYYRWLIIGAVAVAILAGVFFRFWRHLDKKQRTLLLASVVVYFIGFYVRETIINGYWKLLFAPKSFTYYVFATLAEGVQYCGAALLIYAVLSYIAFSFPKFFVALKDSGTVAQYRAGN